MSEENKQKSSIWGGRFSVGPSDLMQEINASITFDKALYSEDIKGSKAHAQMLEKQQIISPNDLKAIQQGLDKIHTEIASGAFSFSVELEDIHMNIETRLAELIGDPAKRLHTARSRNDQVATDIRLYLRNQIDELDVGLTSEEKFSCIVGFSGKIINQDNLKIRIKNSTDTLLIHGDADQVVPSTHLLEAKDFLIRNNVDVETLLIKNCDHHIPMEASSTALNYILKKN